MIHPQKRKELRKALLALEKQEENWKLRPPFGAAEKAALMEKIPAGVQTALEKAFAKAFEGVFLHGTGLIEKTFSKEDAALEYAATDFILEHRPTKRNLKRINQQMARASRKNQLFTTLSGCGLGFLGLGLPDIPLLTATLLQGLYQTALSYGFSYESEAAQIELLQVIRMALPGGEDSELPACDTALETELKQTAKALSDALLLEKFVQGIPIVGVLGGFVNHRLYRRVMRFARIHYQKKYLLIKLETGV